MLLKDISVRLPYKSKVAFEGKGIIQIVTSLYLFCIKRYQSGTFNKLLVEIDEQVVGIELQRMLEVVSVRLAFNFEQYTRLDVFGKKKMILDVIQNGLLTVAEIDNLDKQPILDAYNCCLERRIEYEYFFKGKFYRSPNHRIYAGIWCNYGVDKFESYTVFFDKNKKEMYRIKLMEIEYWNLEPFGEAGWDKLTGDFYLLSKDRSHKWVATPKDQDGDK